MRRLALPLLIIMSICAVAASATASPVPTPFRAHSGPTAFNGHHAIKNGGITVGSNWTLYYTSWHGTDDFCETLTFNSGHSFVGDNASTGTWSGNVTLKFSGGLDFKAGDIYKGKLQKSGPLAGAFVGSVTSKKTSFSPFDLKPGAFC